MKHVILFKSSECDYCRMAQKYLAQLLESNPRYCEISIRIVDEDENPELSERFDYTYVPAFFVDEKLVGEGMLSMEKIRAILEAALC